MNQFAQKNKKLITGVAACLLIAAITMSFQNTPFGPLDKLDTLTELKDTVPGQSNIDNTKMNIKDFDLLLQNMDKEISKMQKEITKADFDKIHQEIKASLDKINLDEINKDIDHAISEIDFNKIQQGVKDALKEIDWNKINNEVKVSLQEAKNEIDKIDVDAIKKEVNDAKTEIEKSKEEIKNIDIDEIIKEAGTGLVKAKEEMRLTKEMFDEMEKDGLIDQQQGFTIEYKNKNLFVNGKKQSDEVSRKYQHYIKGDSFKISISKEK